MKVTASKTFFQSLERLEGIKHIYYVVRAWVKHHLFSKDFYRLLLTVLKDYPWDYSYLLVLERAKLNAMANYFEKSKIFVGWEYVVRDIRLCINLIGIILEEKDLFHFNGDIVFEKSEEYEGDYEVKHTPDFKYVCDVKVNTKNIDRFVPEKSHQKAYLEQPHELYILKAKYLYNKIRHEHMAEWWD